MSDESRMKRIETLMALDPELGTPEGEELNRLVDEQMVAERFQFGQDFVTAVTTEPDNERSCSICGRMTGACDNYPDCQSHPFEDREWGLQSPKS